MTNTERDLLEGYEGFYEGWATETVDDEPEAEEQLTFDFEE